MESKKKKLIRITTVPASLEKLLQNQLNFMNEYFEVIVISSDEQKLAMIGKSQLVPVFCVEFTRKITPFKDIKALWRLYWFFKKEKPFIVHTHTPKAGTIGMLASKLAAVPNRLHTIAGLPLLETKGSKRKLLNFVERLTYACATKLYPNSFGLKDIIIKENLCASKKLKVIGSGSSNGINLSYFSSKLFTENQRRLLRQSLRIPFDSFIFIFVGRLVSNKGINELIKSFQKLYSENQKVTLLLVGPTEENLDPLDTITKNVISSYSSIVYVGYKNDVRPYLAISDVLVFPSYREGLPNVVLQAGAMDLPSIVSDINGCNEIIKNGENGVIIPPKNPEALYRAMKKIAINKELYNQLKLNCRSMISSRYQQQFVWNEILKEYKKLEQENENL